MEIKKKEINPYYFLQKIKSANWEKKLPYFSDNYQEIKINIRAIDFLPPGKFQSDPLLPGGWIAHPQTIRALRKDLFLAGDDFQELEILHQCEGCKKTIDLQFWIHCPYCEQMIPDTFQKISCN